MAKRYLTKEEKRNFILWTRENSNGTLLTSEKLSKICDECNNNPEKIGIKILDLAAKIKSHPEEIEEIPQDDFEMDDIPFVE